MNHVIVWDKNWGCNILEQQENHNDVLFLFFTEQYFCIQSGLQFTCVNLYQLVMLHLK